MLSISSNYFNVTFAASTIGLVSGMVTLHCWGLSWTKLLPTPGKWANNNQQMLITEALFSNLWQTYENHFDLTAIAPRSNYCD